MIGPGMSIFSKYKEIRNADGSVLSVHEALNYINQEINHVFNKEASGLDSVSQTCLFMYENYGYSLIKGGEIESLVTAKDTNTAKLFKEKVISGEKGQIQLSSIESFADSKSFDSISTWPIAMMITAAYDKKTIDGAAEVLAKINNDKLANNAKNLLYRLYMIASKKGMSSDAIKFNGPVSSWTEIKSAANKLKETGVGVQGTLF
jgi:putative DNA methylase